MKKAPEGSRKGASGTSRSYAERVAKGRPNVTFSLPQESVDLLTRLAADMGLSRSQVVSRALQELAARLA